MSRAEAVELYKDKIEVSLDGRQIFYLFFGGAVIVGLVFVLGVMVGRRVEARGHVDRASVAATVDPLAALDRLEGGNGLSFQGALRGNDAPASDVEKTIAAMQDKKAEPTKKTDDKKTDDKKTETPKVEEKKVVEAPKAEAPKAEAPKVEEKKLEAKVEPKKIDEKKVETAKAEEKKADDKKADEKPRFTLQLSSFQDKTEAQNYLEAMKAAGYAAYVTEGAVDGKQYFRVRLGSYKSFDAAVEAKTEFEKSAKKIALVTKL
jgi:cell division septation protein DedD